MNAITTLYLARKIITMNPQQPCARAVAVRDGRILGVGEPEALRGWGPCTTDERFRDQVLMPGLIEGHSHLLEGGMWDFVYVGYHDRRGPDGRVWTGLKSFDQVVARLKEFESTLADPAQPLLGWGFDPIFFGEERMSTRHLDRVSATRPVIVLHASAHLLNVNSLTLARSGIDAATAVDGIAKYADGSPSGELQEFAAMFLVFSAFGNLYFDAGQSERGIRNFGRVAQLAGVTTATDLVNDLGEDSIENLCKVTADPGYPLRLVPALAPMRVLQGDPMARILEARRHNTGKLHFGLVKLVIDGSIQGFTARLRWPGYYNGSPNGLWLVPPQQLQEVILAYHRAGLQVHIHTNGDEASEVALDAIEQALAAHPRWDHRHTLQHCQMADAAMFRRMANLGVCANLFCNHIYYWGDAHYALTMGPDRANRIDAVGTAQRLGVPYAMHSDAPITPIGPLFTAWCAVNRLTSSGRVLGESEKISVADALRAITLGAAYTLKLDHLIGSIEIGKYADFTVLDQDPLIVAPEKLKDVPIWGTVLGGRVFEAPRT
jgi:predicted amidohydrolase YtcJ